MKYDPDLARPDIYGLDLHDQFYDHGGTLIITRVPGGWIYTTYFENGSRAQGTSSVFVPFNDEFKPRNLKVICGSCGHTETFFEHRVPPHYVCPKCSYMTDTNPMRFK
jgi:ribosomal protein S27E